MKLLIQTFNRNYNLAAANCTAAFIWNFRDVIKKKTFLFVRYSCVSTYFFLQVWVSALSKREPFPWFCLQQVPSPLMLFTMMPMRKEFFLLCFVVKSWQTKHCSPGQLTTHKHLEFVFQKEVISSPSYKTMSIKRRKWRDHLAWNSRLQQTNKHKGKSDLSRKKKPRQQIKQPIVF